MHNFSLNRQSLSEELSQFHTLLNSKTDLGERDDILPLFRKCKNLSAYLGMLSREIGTPDKCHVEYSLNGKFFSDLVVGNTQKRCYCFIEFEDGRENSIFKGPVRKRKSRDWSGRFEHGFSQIVDWFRLMDDQRGTQDFCDEFGNGHICYSGMLISGRDHFLGPGDSERLRWRSDRVLVNSKTIYCATFDQLYRDINERFALETN